MYDPSCNIILSAAPIVILLLAAIKVPRETSCAFFVLSFSSFFAVVRTHERSAGNEPLAEE